MALDSARSMKKILRFLFGLFINVCILFILVKAFSYSYDFAYQVFATRAADPGSNRKATIQITQDEPLLDVADSLKTAEVIKDKYAFILKVRIGGYADDIQPVSYTHLTLPTKRIVQISVVAVTLKKKKNRDVTD